MVVVSTPTFSHLFDMTMRLPPAHSIGETPFGERRVFTVSGGQFRGERLTGEILPDGSSDLLLRRADGAFQQDARILLRTDDQALIIMTYRGVRNDEYFRTCPFFETAAVRYSWLNRILAVAVGSRSAESVAYSVFEVL
jgi:Protein of unknown function (DUF3237)